MRKEGARLGFDIRNRQDYLVKEVNNIFSKTSSTYDHRVRNTGLPVRSAILKPHAGMLVVGSVTTSESVLLYVLDFLKPEMEWAFAFFIFGLGTCWRELSI